MRITRAGLDALGIETDSGFVAGAGARKPTTAAECSTIAGSAPQAGPAARSRKSREGTKQSLFIGLLGRAEGATIDEIVARAAGSSTRSAGLSQAR